MCRPLGQHQDAGGCLLWGTPVGHLASEGVFLPDRYMNAITVRRPGYDGGFIQHIGL